MITGVATFIVGAVAGKKADNNTKEIPNIEPIDFDNID